jgi:calcitonin receptor-like
LTVGGLSVSLATLIVSLIIFFSFSSLRCTRITIHKNMFFSMALNNASWLLWYKMVLFKSDVWSQNEILCRIFHVLTTRFMLSTYFWMLCEGIYLRMILVETFLREENLWIWCLLVLGWILPGTAVIAYVVFRHKYENELCWMDPGQSIVFLAVPAICVILINIFLLFNVIRVIRTKLIFENNLNRKNSDISMKSARAVLILIPIFGLHFLLIPMRPDTGSQFEYVYEVISCISTSTQGLSVSFLLCFCNSDVSLLIKKRFFQILNKIGSHFISDFSIGKDVSI